MIEDDLHQVNQKSKQSLIFTIVARVSARRHKKTEQ